MLDMLHGNAGHHSGKPKRLTSVALAGVFCLTLAACSIEGAGTANPGYVSSDGAVSTWEADHRSQPVNLSGTTFAGTEVDTADLRGKVVVINTWYANCPPCRVEAPDLARISNETSAQGVVFFGINGVDAAGSAQAFERTFDISYESIEDRRGQAIAALEGVVPLQAVPTTVVLDRQGRVAASILGVITPSTLESIISDLIAEAK